MRARRAVENRLGTRNTSRREAIVTVETPVENHAHREKERAREILGKPAGGPTPSATERGHNGPSKENSTTHSTDALDSTPKSTVLPQEVLVVPVAEPHERPAGPLGTRQIVALKRWKRAGIEVPRIAYEFGLSEAAVYRHTADVEIDPGMTEDPFPPQQLSPTPATSYQYSQSPMKNGNGQPAVQPQSENQPPPFPIEYVVQPTLQQNNRQTLPIQDGDWERTKLLLMSDAVRRGYTDPVAYVTQEILPTVALAEEWKFRIPGKTLDEKRKFFDRMNKAASWFYSFGEKYLSFVNDGEETK